MGIDTLVGGAGNDTYIVDNSDIVTESLNQGIDTVRASVSYTLTNNVENLVLTGNALNGFGNDLNNTITGNIGNNFISAKGGNDIVNAGLGNDAIDGGEGNDTLNGQVGNDFIFGGLSGNDSLIGANGNDTLNGESGNDTLNGGADDDRIIGQEGDDRLAGNLGADTFVFSFPSEGFDTITDFFFTEGDKIEASASGFGIAVGDTGRFTFDSSNRILFFDATALAILQPGSGFVPSLDINVV